MNVVKHHERRIRKVCDFIDGHLDEALSLEELSSVGASSKFHFHRVFKSFMGISTIQYVLLARLKRASFRLAFEPGHSVTDVAFEAHFESLEGFSRAFSRNFGQTPSQFRKQPNWPSWHSKYEFNPPKIGDRVMDVKVVEFCETQVALIEHKGSPKLVYNTAAKFIDWRKSTGLSPVKTSHTYGVPYSDPADTVEDEFRFDICGVHQGNVPENTFGVKSGVIPGGRCAVAIHEGSHDLISDTVYYLYRNWLPESGEELRDFPCFFHYVNLVHEVDECDLITHIYLPIC
ncbi:AraC family transcriptional regulator [Vibrio crassostreae]|nr:AraC family transcriptional regulator [Vibrio crassostreae]CAK2236772.1 AraC family transcriptional regulator [Vibrio crassostreae]CAK2396563.1 AraC family transcriptional regulator [Vibrio crassostreae]CAK2565703.1 AraC family transcriptional regulator [Vibrio crassostreae]